MLVSLTVGKVDAGVAVLLTEDKRLIEFPSVLLPPDISSGSIVDVTVSRNAESESRAAQKFSALQDTIYRNFGLSEPSAPSLRCRNATQTSVVLEWDPIELATAELRSLSLYRNGQKAGNIPRPRDMLSTKISGLAIDSEYTFHLVLKTSAGTFPSPKLTVRTHKMTDLSGITVTPGILPQALLASLKETLARIGAKMIDGVRIDTTHFVTTEGRGRDWERAVEMNVPVVVPDWVKGCEREGKLVRIREYYLNADPRLRQVGPSVHQQQQNAAHQQRQEQQAQQQQQQQGSEEQLAHRPRTPQEGPRTEVTPPTPETADPAERIGGTVAQVDAERVGVVKEVDEASESGEDARPATDEVAAGRQVTVGDEEVNDESSEDDGHSGQEANGAADGQHSDDEGGPGKRHPRGQEEAGDFDEVQL